MAVSGNPSLEGGITSNGSATAHTVGAAPSETVGGDMCGEWRWLPLPPPPTDGAGPATAEVPQASHGGGSVAAKNAVASVIDGKTRYPSTTVVVQP
jgi:hypothetical protein